MNQIFDWLRDSISMLHRKNMYDSYWERDMYLAENACIAERDKTIQQIHEIINDAESKFGYHAICYLDSPCEYQNEDIRVVDDENDCCEWKQEKFLEFSLSDCVTSCGHAEHYAVGIDKYCRHCGKPIKISEVE